VINGGPLGDRRLSRHLSTLLRMTSSLTPSPGGVSFDQARRYVAGARWQFAKTMPQWPHEYTVRHWQPELEADFFAFAVLIRSNGIVKPWPPAPMTPRYRHTYLELNEWEYWTMGEPIPDTTVINRARVP
jgi:hypothetical protein